MECVGLPSAVCGLWALSHIGSRYRILESQGQVEPYGVNTDPGRCEFSHNKCAGGEADITSRWSK